MWQSSTYLLYSRWLLDLNEPCEWRLTRQWLRHWPPRQLQGNSASSSTNWLLPSAGPVRTSEGFGIGRWGFILIFRKLLSTTNGLVFYPHFFSAALFSNTFQCWGQFMSRFYAEVLWQTNTNARYIYSGAMNSQDTEAQKLWFTTIRLRAIGRSSIPIKCGCMFLVCMEHVQCVCVERVVSWK